MSILDETETDSEISDEPRPSLDAARPWSDPDARWSADAGRLVDAVGLVVALHFLITVVGEFTVARPLAVTHLLFFLGWVTVRAFGAAASTLTAVVAAVVSVTITIATSMVALHFFDWAWRPTATLLASLGVGMALVPYVRPPRNPRPDGVAPPETSPSPDSLAPKSRSTSTNGVAPTTVASTVPAPSAVRSTPVTGSSRVDAPAADDHAGPSGAAISDPSASGAPLTTSPSAEDTAHPGGTGTGSATVDASPASSGSGDADPGGADPVAPVADGDRRHLERGTFHLLVNTAATGALGAAFWLFAARIADEAAVGTAVAASSLLIAFAFLAQLNLPTAVSRYVPAAGASQRDLVGRSYRDAMIASVVLAGGTLAVAVVRGGDVVTGGGWGLSLALALSIPVWVIFALQDAVLVAVRRTVWVPVENIVTTFAKYALVPVLLGLGGAGILLAWTLPALAAIPVVTAALWRRFLHPGRERYTGAGYLAYALKDFPGAAVYLLAFRLVPALVLETGDAIDGAYIGLPWTILTVIALALPMLSRMLLAELSHDDSDVRSLMRRAYALIGLVLVPGSLVGAVLVHPMLSIAGDQYAARGSAVLALGLLGMAPAAVAECQLALLRYYDRAALTGALQAVRGVLLLGAVVALISADRVDQIGWAFVAVNIIGVLIAAPFLRNGGRRRDHSGDVSIEDRLDPLQGFSDDALRTDALGADADAPDGSSAEGIASHRAAPHVGAPTAIVSASDPVSRSEHRSHGTVSHILAEPGDRHTLDDPVDAPDRGTAAPVDGDADRHTSAESAETDGAVRPGTDGANDVEVPTHRRLSVALAPLLVGTVVAAIGMIGADIDDIGAYGLIEATGIAHLVGTGIVVAGGVWLAAETGRRRWLVHLHVLTTIVLLHGLPGLVEPNPRFGVAWLHTGFADAIAESGELLVNLDARFSWPGFFTGTALIQNLTGSDDTQWFIRFAPVLFSVFAVAAIEVLGRAVHRSPAQRSVAMLAFLVFNWTGQDYFAPQAVGFASYLAIVCLLLVRFPGEGLRPDQRLGRLLRVPSRPVPSIPPEPSVAAPPAFGALIVVLGTSMVLVATHQLTPGFLTGASLLLALTASTRLRTLPLLVVLVTLAWLSFAAESWWLGNVETLFGSIGDASGLVEDNVAERTGGAVPERQTVLLARIGSALGLWALAGLAIVVAWWRRRTEVALICLFVAPFPLFLAQPYGGEMIIRVLYFSLVPAVLLIVGLVRGMLRTPGRRLVAGVALAAVVPVFMLARFGNEQFEVVRDEDITTLEALYADAPEGSAVFVASRQTLLDTARVGELRFRVLDSLDVDEVAEELDDELARRADAAYILLSRNQEVFWELSRSLPEGWMTEFADELLADERFQLVARDGAAHVIRYRP